MSRSTLVAPRYVPILKGREGEYGALQQLAGEVKSELTPIIEVPPIPWDYTEDVPAKTIDDHISRVIPKLQRSWGSAPIWIDLLWISPDERLKDGAHPMRTILDMGRSAALSLIPATELIRDEEYQKAVRDAVAIDRRGLALRLRLADFEDPTGGYEAVESFIMEAECRVEETDLIFDIGPISEAGIGSLLVATNAVLQQLPGADRWRTVILAGGSFPENLIGLAPDDISEVVREEWRLWRSLHGRAGRLRRRPVFGDYGVAHPAPSEVDPRVMRPSASVRYTTEDHWIVPKGRNLRAHGFDQFHSVCEVLIERADYSGNDFSWGDECIWECAHRRCGPGNLTTWRKVGTSHHLTFVVRQLSRLGI